MCRSPSGFRQCRKTDENLAARPRPLAAIGAPGCLLYATPDTTYFGAFRSDVFEQELPIPYNTSIAGAQVFSQAAAFAFANPLGLLTSNGIMHRVGL